MKVKVSGVEEEADQLGLPLDVEVGQLDLRHPGEAHSVGWGSRYLLESFLDPPVCLNVCTL